MGDLFTSITEWLRTVLLGWGIPSEAVPWIFATARAFLLGFSGLMLVILLIWFERKAIARMQDRIGPNRVGPFGLIQPFADMLKLVIKEDLIPPGADRLLFHAAPVLVVMGVVALWAVLPIASTAYGVDLNVGALFLIAAGAIGALGILMAGWSSNNKFALLGAFRAVAQLVSYEIPAALALLVPVALAGTLRLNGIVEAQREAWFVFAAPLAALVFLVASLAEVARAPFELLEAESEIVAGFHVEYSGIRFGMFMAAEFLHSFTAGALIAVLFLGGWQGPWAAEFPTLGAIYFAVKAAFGYMLMVWARGTLPRIRIDQMLALSWIVLTPLMLVLISAQTVLERALQGQAAWVRAAAGGGLNLALMVAMALLMGWHAGRERRARAKRAGVVTG